MNIENIASELKKCELFSHLEIEELISLAKISSPISFEKKQIIINQDEVGLSNFKRSR